MICNLLSSAVYFNYFRAFDDQCFNLLEGLFEPMPSRRAFLQSFYTISLFCIKIIVLYMFILFERWTTNFQFVRRLVRAYAELEGVFARLLNNMMVLPTNQCRKIVLSGKFKYIEFRCIFRLFSSV